MMPIPLGQSKRFYPGAKLGMLTVLEFTGRADQKGRSIWHFRCDCGKEFDRVSTSVYQKGVVYSCGCYRKQAAREGSTRARLRHGRTETKLYVVWIAMKQRCERPSNKGYHNYGGRGIRVCEEWHDFAKFAEWADTHGYAEGLEIDRIDNDGNYEPSNCRWATSKENSWNRRGVVMHAYWGEQLPLTAASKRFGVDTDTIRRRLARGLTPEEAVTMKGRLNRL